MKVSNICKADRGWITSWLQEIPSDQTRRRGLSAPNAKTNKILKPKAVDKNHFKVEDNNKEHAMHVKVSFLSVNKTEPESYHKSKKKKKKLTQ